MATTTAIAAIAGVAIAAGGTAYSIATKPGTPKPPPVQQAAPPPPAPPPPPPLPPPPTATPAAVDTSVAAERARLRRQRGIASTILTSPLGIAGTAEPPRLGG